MCESAQYGYSDDPFPTISDKTIQRTADIYLPIPGALLSLGAAIALAAKAPPLASGIFTLFGATATMSGKVVSSISDRRMLKQPMKAAQEAKVDEKEWSPKGCVESSAYYANLVNLGATIVSVAGIIVGGLFLFGVIFNNDTNNDTHSSGKDSSTFSNKEILGIVLNIVTLLDNSLKALKGCGIEYRDRITQLTKDHNKLEEERQKRIHEEQTWLPEIIQRRQKVGEMVEMLRIRVAGIDDKGGDNRELKELYSRCETFLAMLHDKQADLDVKEHISRELNSQFSFSEPLIGIEEELANIGRKLYNSLNEYEQRNKIMNLLEKISISPILYKVEALEECFQFLNSGIEEQARFTQEGKAHFRSLLTNIQQSLKYIKGELTGIIEFVLEDMQMNVIGCNMKNLIGIINELEAQNQELRLSVPNFDMR